MYMKWWQLEELREICEILWIMIKEAVYEGKKSENLPTLDAMIKSWFSLPNGKVTWLNISDPRYAEDNQHFLMLMLCIIFCDYYSGLKIDNICFF